MLHSEIYRPSPPPPATRGRAVPRGAGFCRAAAAGGAVILKSINQAAAEEGRKRGGRL